MRFREPVANRYPYSVYPCRQPTSPAWLQNLEAKQKPLDPPFQTLLIKAESCGCHPAGTRSGLHFICIPHDQQDLKHPPKPQYIAYHPVSYLQRALAIPGPTRRGATAPMCSGAAWLLGPRRLALAYWMASTPSQVLSMFRKMDLASGQDLIYAVGPLLLGTNRVDEASAAMCES